MSTSSGYIAPGSAHTTTTVNVDLHLWPDPDPNHQPSGAKVKDIWQVDNHIKHVFTTVTLGFIGTILCSVGTVGNLVNVAVFCKMGFKVGTCQLLCNAPQGVEKGTVVGMACRGPYLKRLENFAWTSALYIYIHIYIVCYLELILSFCAVAVSDGCYWILSV